MICPCRYDGWITDQKAEWFWALCTDHIIKNENTLMKIRSSCEIEYFVETHLSLQAVCDTY